MGAVGTNPYTSQTISGYNASPPPDDGTQTVANQLSWAKHKTKLADPIKTLAEGVNTAVSATFAKTINTDADVRNQISGSLALEWATATIGTDAISPTYSAVLLGTESGATSDTLQVITATGVYNGALLTIRQRNATEEINLIHATSTAATATAPNIYLNNKSRVSLDTQQKAIELRYDSGTASGWVETGGAGLAPVNTGRATVASAATTADIWGANGNQIDWTGTTTCTGFPAAPQAGVERTLICAGAAPFTAGANMLIDGVTSGNTVTCAANDKMIVRAITTTQFMLSRVKYDGQAQVTGLTLLQTVTASASATVDLETGVGSTYNSYVVIAEGIQPATDNATLMCRLKRGGVYPATGYNYHTNVSSDAAATYSGVAARAAVSIIMSAALDSGSGQSVMNFTLQINNANNAAMDQGVTWQGFSRDSTISQKAEGYGEHDGTGVLQGIRFLMSSGNISIGTFRLYGISK